MMAGKGDLLPVSAFPVDGTWPTGTEPLGEAEHRRSRSRSGTRRSASSATSARWSAPTPPSAPRSTPGRPGRRARARSGHADFRARDFKGLTVHDPGGARGLHRLRPLRRGLPGQGQGEPAPQGHRHGTRSRRSGSGARELRVLPRPPGSRPHHGEAGPQGLPVPRAALRVLGGLRGLRRDPLHQAPDPALRRPGPDRQRHRLLLDLRREPAHHPVHRQTATDAARRGRTRSSRTTPSSALACASPSTATRTRRATS